ncbi:MAG TPA: ABC transporter permease [Pseudomonadales bacterium]
MNVTSSPTMQQASAEDFKPTASDFQPATRNGNVEVLHRPSLSYWQDAWIRLKANNRALISLYLVVFLFLLTLFGPYIWQVDPSDQDLDQISQPPSFNKQALLIHDAGQWLPDTEELPENFYQYLNAEDLAATTEIVIHQAHTKAVRLSWQPVEGAYGYVIYRNEYPPENIEDLGLPLAETEGVAQTYYQDRLNPENKTYYYSIVASDGLDEAETFRAVPVKVEQAITIEEAKQRGLVNSAAIPGEMITLKSHPLGTDYLGRDMLARIIAGARTSLFIGTLAPAVFILLGVIYGSLAGYLGARIDNWMMRFADFVVALPFLLFMILFRIAFGVESGESGIFPMLIAMILLGWPGMARLVRGQILQIRNEAYVQAARLLGANSAYLIVRHMIPNVMGVILVTITFAIPSAIFTEAFLSFIGMGVSPPTASWGSMCNEGIKTMLSHPHELFFPALFISITVLAFNLLGDGLRDALDSRLRARE